MKDQTELPASSVSNEEQRVRSDATSDHLPSDEAGPRRQPLGTGNWYTDAVLRALLAPTSEPTDLQADYNSGNVCRHFDIERLAIAAGVTVVQLLTSIMLLTSRGFITHEYDRACTGVFVWLVERAKNRV